MLQDGLRLVISFNLLLNVMPFLLDRDHRLLPVDDNGALRALDKSDVGGSQVT